MNMRAHGSVGKEKWGNRPDNQDEGYFRQLITDHLTLIERLCFKVIRQHLYAAGLGSTDTSDRVTVENESLELSNQVIDSLQKDDFKVLRQFKGNAKLSTYITSIVARHAVDMVRKKRGRSREKERAQKLGNLGVLLYEELCVQGNSPEQTQIQLKEKHHISVSLNEIEEMARQIKGKKLEMPADDALVFEASSIQDEESQQLIISDNRGNPGQLLEEEQRQTKIQEVLNLIVDQLTGEERLIIRLRFPVQGDKPAKVSKVASALSITEKAAYKRIARILNKCKTIVEQMGVSLNEIL